jgi:hypothetical protein
MKLVKTIAAMAVVAVMGMAIPFTAHAQGTTASQWLFSFVVNGNVQDESRIPQAEVVTCIQAEDGLICRDTQGHMFDGEIEGDTITLTASWTMSDGYTGAFSFCFSDYSYRFGSVGFCSASGPHEKTYHADLKFKGTMVGDDLLKGTWSGVLTVGIGTYPVKGTWKAIRAGVGPDGGDATALLTPRAPVAAHPDVQARVISASVDLTKFVVDDGRAEHSFVSAMPCNGIKSGDHVMLHRDAESGAVRFSTPSVTCYVRSPE